MKASKKLLKKYRTKLKENNKELLQQKKVPYEGTFIFKEKYKPMRSKLEKVIFKNVLFDSSKGENGTKTRNCPKTIGHHQQYMTVVKRISSLVKRSHLSRSSSTVYDREQLNTSTNESKDTLDENNWLREISKWTIYR